jgi:CheY-like chemotaxis protein
MSKHLLIIDDDRDLVMGLSAVLRRANYTVSVAHDGLAGVEKATAETPDLILCDLMMPGMNGRDVRAQLAAHPVLQAIPFILLTARAMDGEQQSDAGLGITAYIAKPFNIQNLLTSVAALLDKS